MVNVEFFQKMEKACCQSIEDMKIDYDAIEILV